jgi:hypothetical protein
LLLSALPAAASRAAAAAAAAAVHAQIVVSFGRCPCFVQAMLRAAAAAAELRPPAASAASAHDDCSHHAMCMCGGAAAHRSQCLWMAATAPCGGEDQHLRRGGRLGKVGPWLAPPANGCNPRLPCKCVILTFSIVRCVRAAPAGAWLACCATSGQLLLLGGGWRRRCSPGGPGVPPQCG